MAYIEISNLNYSYPCEEIQALKNINMQVGKGEIILIVGKSGSGKSTLGRCISSSIPNFYGGTIGGEVRINGKNIKDLSRYEIAKEVTMVFQDPEKQLMMNKVHREIAFGLENVGVNSEEIKRRVWEALQFSNILDIAYRDISSLSGGQKQKVAIASAIAFMPNCIIMDEPLSQLDPASAEEVMAFVKKINEELGITIIIIEQRIEKWFDLADKISVMDKGSMLFYGTKEEIYREKSIDFMPMYLKVIRDLNIESCPKNIKEARNIINSKFKTEDIYEKECKEKKSSEKNFIKSIFTKEKEENIALKLQGVGFNYGHIEALKDLNLSINKGEFCCILGPNGAGKSTLLKSIMKLLNFNGNIKCFNKDLSKMNRLDIGKSIAYVSQNPNDYISKETVYQELKFTLDNYNIKDLKVIDDVLQELGITHLKHKNPRDISGGERQRVAIASMLVLNPDMILLDEPTRGLDGESKKRLGDTLLKINKKGCTIILVTHDVDFAAEYAERFILMFDGSIVADGNRKEIFSRGIYYNTVIHKLFKDVNKNIYTFKDFKSILKEYEEKI